MRTELLGNCDMTASDYCDEDFLIIPGVAKAGTTSLHHYLAAHPNVCASQPKELFYFLPLDFPLESPVRHGRDPLSAYLSRFPGYKPRQVRMEASPWYLLLPQIPELIGKVLPRSRFVILLRDPISRLISYHQTGKLWGGLPRGQSFDEYVSEIRRVRATKADSPWHTYPLEEGLYTERIRLWQQIFGKDRILTIWFDDLNASPYTAVCEVCTFAGLDPAFYRTFEFENVNPAREVRNERVLTSLRSWSASLRRTLPKGSALRRVLNTVYRQLEWTVLYKLVTRVARKSTPSADTIAFLREFYAADVAALPSVLSSPPPWSKKYTAL
jgi:hypothetical protein